VPYSQRGMNLRIRLSSEVAFAQVVVRKTLSGDVVERM